MYTVKNVAADRDLGCFHHHNDLFSPHSHTLMWEPYIDGFQLKFGDEVKITDSYYDFLKPMLDEYVQARILFINKIEEPKEKFVETIKNISKIDPELENTVVESSIEEIEKQEVEESKLEEPKEDKKSYTSKRKK